MKKIISLVWSLAFITPALADPGAEPIFGVWARDHHVEKLEFFDCDGKLCARGTLPRPDGSPPPLILRHATKVEPNKWRGDLFNPENGKIYEATITLDSPARLTLTGCLIAFLCQSEGWTKVTTEAPSPKSATPRRRITNP